MNRLASLALLALLASGCATNPGPVAPAAPSPADTRAVLSLHKTDAVFAGIERQPCRHLTAECPDRCDHGGLFAKFTITNYRAYEKRDTYGDPRTDQFQLRIRDGRGAPTVPAELLTKILALKTGDTVHLDWAHEYVTHAGSSRPERTVTRLDTTGR